MMETERLLMFNLNTGEEECMFQTSPNKPTMTLTMTLDMLDNNMTLLPVLFKQSLQKLKM